jgi:DNA-binding MarR family transcriptional regulator/GNAT superfamily N-acetyltransferase
MDGNQVRQVRRFNRLVTQTVGALEDSYLRRGRPLGEARLIFEIGREGAAARRLRERLGLDSGYLTRLLQSLQRQGLIEVRQAPDDRRGRSVTLTQKGVAELAAYDRLSDGLAHSVLAKLEAEQRRRLTEAMGEVERLLNAASVDFAVEAPTSADARWCLQEYYREIAARFEAGFDPAREGAGSGESMAPPAGLFVVARLRGDPIGCGGFRRVDEATGEIKRVWIAPAARGLGVATRLVRKLEAGAREIGLTKLRLDTNRALNEAHALYRKEGYREVERFNANPYAHLWFEKRLTSAESGPPTKDAQ